MANDNGSQSARSGMVNTNDLTIYTMLTVLIVRAEVHALESILVEQGVQIDRGRYHETVKETLHKDLEKLASQKNHASVVAKSLLDNFDAVTAALDQE